MMHEKHLTRNNGPDPLRTPPNPLDYHSLLDWKNFSQMVWVTDLPYWGHFPNKLHPLILACADESFIATFLISTS